MKNIGVFVSGLNSEYSIEIMDGISDFFRGKDVRLFFAQTRVPHYDGGIYEYQYWSSTVFFNNKDIDAIIVVCGDYAVDISVPKLSSALSNYKNIPVISIGMELFLPKNCFTHADCKSAYFDVVSHLKNVHGCRRIAFFSANQINSEEALERLEAFKAALKANELFFNRSLILNGKFSESYAYDEILRRYKSKDDINFDAILCANDLTASGCMYALQRLGVDIPNDVKIIGFDDSSKAEIIYPKLSTLNQNIYQQGYTAAELAYNVVSDKTKSYARCTKTSVSPIYRQSCGCIPLSSMENVYKNQHGDTCYKNAEDIRRLKIDGEYYNYLREMKSVYALMQLFRADNDLKKFFYSLRYILETSSMSNAAVCFFDEPVIFQSTETFELPRNMYISMLVDMENNIEIFEPNMTFNPKRKFIHEEYFKMDKGNYIFSPVFSGNKNYGYIICKVNNLNFAIYTVFMKLIVTALVQAYEYTIVSEQNQKLQEENILLYQNTRTYNTKSKIDPMTYFLNRRGFYDFAQQRIDLALDSDCTGMVLYFDLDNTNLINDTFGSDTGDLVIKIMSSILGRILRGNDVVGRITGDKFAAIAVEMKPEHTEKIRQRLERECLRASKENHLPFLITCCFGATEFSTINSKLKNLLEEAARSLFAEKDEKHLKTGLTPIPDDESEMENMNGSAKIETVAKDSTVTENSDSADGISGENSTETFIRKNDESAEQKNGKDELL